MTNILTFNWHEGYIALLGKIPGIALTIVERNKGGYDRWMHEFRPCPRGSRLVSLKEALDDLRKERFDLVVAHDPTDLLSTMDSPVPQILVLHNRLDTMIALGGDTVDRQGYIDWFQNLVRMVSDLEIVSISESKQKNWGVSGPVILPGVDLSEWGPWTGVRPAVLQVGNFLKERDLMLGYKVMEEALEGLPRTLVGINPSIPESRMSRNQSDLSSLFREHRVYLHASVHPYEDGYNLALLEAMASGMPVVALEHPDSPIVHGSSGLLSDRSSVLGEHLRLLLGDREKARTLGENARLEVSKRFPLDRFIDNWVSLIRKKTSAWSMARKYREERGELIDRIPSGARTILDVGCGAGKMGRGIRQKLGSVELIGIEKNPLKAKEAQSHYDRILVEDATQWVPDMPKESVDVIVFADVIEHVEEPGALISRYLPWLSPSGVVVLSVPNIRYHKILKGLAEGHFRYEEEGILDRSHLRFFTRESMLDLLGESGLWVESVSANVDSRYRWVQEGTGLSNGQRTDIDLGSVVVRDQGVEDLKDLFTVQYIFLARRKLQAIFDRVDRLSADGAGVDLIDILQEARLDASLSREEKTEIDIRIGEIACRGQQWGTAREAYERSLEVLSMEQDERGALGLAVLELLTGNSTQALVWFKMAFDMNPGSWKALSGFAMACQELDRKDEALFYYAQSLFLHPLQEDILELFSRLAEESGQLSETVAVFRNYLKEIPEAVSERVRLIEILLELGREEEAAREIRLFSRLHPDHEMPEMFQGLPGPDLSSRQVS